MQTCNVTKFAVYDVARDKRGRERAGTLRFTGTRAECADFIVLHMPCAILRPVRQAG